MKLQKLTTEKRARLMEVAHLKAQIPGFKTLAIEVGLTEMYTKQLVSQMVRSIRHVRDVSRETKARVNAIQHPDAR